VSIAAEWQSSVPYYSKSASQKLKGIADAFGFAIEPSILDDHEELATLRWKLQCGLGRQNPVATKALTKLFFNYLRGGRDFLYDKDAIDRLFEKLIDQYGVYDTQTSVSPPEGGQLKVLEAAEANPLIAKYHFLGYGRDDGLHLGLVLRREDIERCKPGQPDADDQQSEQERGRLRHGPEPLPPPSCGDPSGSRWQHSPGGSRR
jgi:hypothetical protein